MASIHEGDQMKGIATPMVGGTFSVLVPVLLVFPALFVLWKIPGEETMAGGKILPHGD